jgi:hypothetical protein
VKQLVLVLFPLLALLGATCNPPPGVTTNEVSEPERQMVLAQSLEQGGDLRRAIHLYSIVADNAPETARGATATLKTALLLSSPRNPSRNDSLALLWFRTTISRTRSADEQLQAEVSMALLDRLLLRAKDSRRQRTIVDSLQTALRRQSGTILSQTRRLQDMEREVVAAQSELQRLKDVDETISRSRQVR